MARSRFRTSLYRAFSVEFVRCPTCGRELKVAAPAGRYPYLAPPEGELEAMCGAKYGTHHNVPMHWKPDPTASEWEAAKHAPIGRPRPRITIGVVIFTIVLVAFGVMGLLDAVGRR